MTIPPKPLTNSVAMTREALTRGRTRLLRCIVLHATAGAYPSDYDWLRRGGAIDNPVSTHYYIDKTGKITQFVADHDTAWHAGASNWTLDGTRYSGLNPNSIGIELSNRNDGKDLYPAAQIASAVALVRYLVAQYDIPPSQLVRHLDISPGRKTDPAGFDWDAFREAVYRAEPPAPEPPPAGVLLYYANSPLRAPLGTPQITTVEVDRLTRIIATRGTPYNRDALWQILTTYGALCERVGLDYYLVIGQMLHETGWLRSFWSQPPQHNPAGIGVNGVSQLAEPKPRAGWAYNEQRSRWEVGVSFPDWPSAIAAHVGRLAAYVYPAESRSPAVAALIGEALAWRELPERLHGSANTAMQLGQKFNPMLAGWASPGARYGEAIAAVANLIWREVTKGKE